MISKIGQRQSFNHARIIQLYRKKYKSPMVWFFILCKKLRPCYNLDVGGCFADGVWEPHLSVVIVIGAVRLYLCDEKLLTTGSGGSPNIKIRGTILKIVLNLLTTEFRWFFVKHKERGGLWNLYAFVRLRRHLPFICKSQTQRWVHVCKALHVVWVIALF